MWICEICETYNQDDHVKCRICGTDKVTVQPPVQVMPKEETSDTNRLGGQLVNSMTAAEKPVISFEKAPDLHSAETVLADTGSLAGYPLKDSKDESGTLSPVSTDDIGYEITLERLAKKRRKTRIALAILNAGLLAVNIITVIWITK